MRDMPSTVDGIINASNNRLFGIFLFNMADEYATTNPIRVIISDATKAILSEGSTVGANICQAFEKYEPLPLKACITSRSTGKMSASINNINYEKCKHPIFFLSMYFFEMLPFSEIEKNGESDRYLASANISNRHIANNNTDCPIAIGKL